ncbi:MAG: lactonase family protein [Deltaproteobacteria bacterium]|nr:MAG: lactonase family protein [Deltaproteobacteria bacterium]
MRRLTLVGLLGTGLLAARPVVAGTILYATAASQARVDGFCVREGGGLAPAASVHVDTAGMEPRRLVVANGVLFVGELDRVEAFKIGPHGALTPMAATKTITSPAMEVIDMAVAADGQTLYVAQNGPDRIAAYPIAAATSRSWDFTSCIQGRVNGSYRALHIRNGLLYASEQLTPGRIAIFPINAGGSLHDPAECTTPTGKTRPEATPAISDQQRIQRPRSFVFLDDRVYVDEVGTKRIKAFLLQADGLFPPPVKVGKRLRWERPLSRTDPVLAYVDVVLFRSTLLASQFEKGRIDAYRLKPDGRLRRQPTRQTKQDVRTSPVRMAVSDDGVLYVSAGEFDRIQAFRLRQSDGLPATTPFSETDEQTGSFPNDVALAMLSEGCR